MRQATVAVIAQQLQKAPLTLGHAPHVPQDIAENLLRLIASHNELSAVSMPRSVPQEIETLQALTSLEAEDSTNTLIGVHGIDTWQQTR